MPSISMKIKHGSDRDKKIREALRARFKMSEQDMQKQHKRWREAEENALAYIPERDVDAARRAKREGGKPAYTTIVVPYSYAILMAAHTYWTSVFLARNPVLQYQARHGEGMDSVQAVEALMEYQTNVGSHLVPYYIWLLDVGKYGLGVVGNYWEEEKIVVPEIVEEEELYMGIFPTGNKKKIKTSKAFDGYHGNKLYNIRPYDWYPDTRVPLNRFQEGEFCGVQISLGWNELWRRADKGQYIKENVERLRDHRVRQRNDQGTSQYEYPNQADHIIDGEVKDVGYQDLIEMEVELSPDRWGLGKESYPEKWVFTCTKDFTYLIEARPKGMYHNKYSYSIIELEPEGYALFKRGMMEIVEPLQDVMDWLVNTHFYNVRKALNDQFIIDPSKVTMKDVYNPLPGGLWRLRPEAYGTDVRTVATQLAVTDVTQAHLKDSEYIGQLIQRASGVVDNIMGMVNPGGRKTATEVRTSSSFSANRLKTQSEYFSAMGFAPNSQMMLQNTQQYYDLERKYKVAGDLLSEKSAIQITPEQIQGFYDFVAVDGTLPVDRFAQANLWSRLLQEGSKMPQVLAQYDLGKIFAWVAQISGLKNINQFKIQVEPNPMGGQVGPGGELIPIGGQDGARAITGEGGGAAESGGRPPEPGQIEGMGTT